MKLPTLFTAMVAAFSIAGASLPALAQAPAAQGQTRVEAGQMRATALIDRDAYSSDDVEIGEIEDLILNAQHQVILAVIEVETRLGFTDKYVAVPIAQVTPSANNRERVTLSLTRDQVKALPGFRYED